MKNIYLIFFLFIIAFGSTQNAKAQEIPNGDNDVLWERPLNGRTVNDAKFHPINGNIIAAVDYEIWEIDPKDGHTIRIFEGGYPADAKDKIRTINITSDGYKIITGGAMGQKGILIWDYNTGLVTKIISLNEVFDVYENIGIYPDNNRIVFNTYQNEYGSPHNTMYINEYNLALDSIKRVGYLYDTYCARFRMSDNGLFIAYGFAKGELGNFSYTMELWDAETLTKIKDFGELKVNSFKDIQFSYNNQYIGLTVEGGWKLYIFNNMTTSILKIFDKTFAFAFSDDNKKLFFYTDYGPQKAEINVISLLGIDTVYQYTKSGSCLRVNKQNEIFSIGFDTTLGAKMQFFSNKWFEVGVKSPTENKTGITSTKYSDNTLNLKTSGIDFINSFVITDILGKQIYIQHEIPIINNQITIKHFLPTGNYLLKIISNGKEYTSKFMVVR